MKKQELRAIEADALAERLMSTNNPNQISSVLEDLSTDDLVDLSSIILRNGHTIVHSLVQREKLTALRILFQRGVRACARNAQGSTPLRLALRHNCLPVAVMLIEDGEANVSEMISKRKGTTLLHLMVTCDRPDAVKLLLNYKVDVNVRNREKRTPFHLAAVYGNTAMTTILMSHEQCDVNAVDETGHTALMLAILNDNQDVARCLLECPQVDVVLKDSLDRSCLHLAVARGHVEVVRTLLRRTSANLHARERCMGRTPMHIACALVCSQSGVVSSNCLFDEDDHHCDLNLNAMPLAETAGWISSRAQKGPIVNGHVQSSGHVDVHAQNGQIDGRINGQAQNAHAHSHVHSGVVNFQSKPNQISGQSHPGRIDHHVHAGQTHGHIQNGQVKGQCESSNCGDQTSSTDTDNNIVFHGNQDLQKTQFAAWSEKVDTLNVDEVVGSNSDVSFPDISQIEVAFLPKKIGHQNKKNVAKKKQGDRLTGWISSDEEPATMGNGARSDAVNGDFGVAVSMKVPKTSNPRIDCAKKQQTPRQLSNKNLTCAKSQPQFTPRTKSKMTNATFTPDLRARHSIAGEHLQQMPRSQPSTYASTSQKHVMPMGTKRNFSRPATAPASQRVRSSVSFANPELTVTTSRLCSRKVPVLSQSSSVLNVTPFNIGLIRCKIVSLLLQHGADANLMTNFRKSPLHIAAIMGTADVMAVLLPRVTNVNVLSVFNKTALHLAVERNHIAVTSQLIHAGANLSMRDVAGMTALHIAARFGFIGIVTLLLKARANPDITDFKQMVPIHHACIHDHPDVIDMLVLAGARLDIVDVDGLAPMDHRNAAFTGSHPESSSDSLDNYNTSSSLSREVYLASAKSEKGNVALLFDDEDKDRSIPMTIPVKPALHFHKA